MTAREELQSATRNNHKAQLNNIWNIIDRVELTDDELNEVNTCMAWIKEDLESFYYDERVSFEFDDYGNVIKRKEEK